MNSLSPAQRQALVLEHRKLPVKMAQSFCNRWPHLKPHFDDLVSEANVALVEASYTWQEGRGASWKSWAWLAVRAGLQRVTTDAWKAIRNLEFEDAKEVPAENGPLDILQSHGLEKQMERFRKSRPKSKKGRNKMIREVVAKAREHGLVRQHDSSFGVYKYLSGKFGLSRERVRQIAAEKA